jgi:hydroxymethylbilane synthase
MAPLRLGTRGSPLALWQAHHVAERLRLVVEPRAVELVLIETHGDRIQDQPLAALGGFGVFTKAIQDALLARRCDVAVHSLKDLPTIPVPGLKLTAVPPRGPTGDVFISRKHRRFGALPQGAIVGTSSLRRRAQLLNERPDLKPVDLRGNIDTRLRKLEAEGLDAIILAEAGLERLGLREAITEVLDPTWMLPAVGQGAIGLECREDDTDTVHLVEAVNDPDTWSRVVAERAMLAALGGGCLVPIGASSKVEAGTLTLRGTVLTQDGKRRIVDTCRADSSNATSIGCSLARQLVISGADELLRGINAPGASPQEE